MKLSAFLLALLFAFQLETAHARVIDRVVAIVNDEAVTWSEVEELLAPILQQINTVHDPLERERLKNNQTSIALDELINQRLLLQEAKARRIHASPQEIDAYCNRIKSRQGWDDEQFKQYLQSQGIEYTQFRTNIADKLVIQKTMRTVLGSKLQVSDGELQEFYKEKLTQTSTEFEVEASQILIPVDSKASAAEDAAAKQEINEILERAQSGEDFAKLAIKYSRGPGAETGGKLGTVRRGSLPEFEKILFTLEPGEVGGPLRTRYGYHIFRVDARHTLPIEGFEAVQDELRQELLERKIAEESAKWVETLRQKAFIETRL